MAKKPRLPESPLTDIPLLDTPEKELQLRLDLLQQKFVDDPSHALPAFEVIEALVANAWQRNDETSDISIPRWAAELLLEKYMLYRDKTLGGTGATLGEAFGIEGGGQGAQRKIKKDILWLRNIRIATHIATQEADGVKIEAAIQDMATQTGLSPSTVRGIWDKNADHARSSWHNFTMRKTS